MKTLYFSLLLLFTFIAGNALAGDLKEIQLKDGSLIYCEVISLSDGVYNMNSSILGKLTILQLMLLLGSIGIAATIAYQLIQ